MSQLEKKEKERKLIDKPNLHGKQWPPNRNIFNKDLRKDKEKNGPKENSINFKVLALKSNLSIKLISAHMILIEILIRAESKCPDWGVQWGEHMDEWAWRAVSALAPLPVMSWPSSS